MPYIKGIVAELGFKRKEVTYEQQKRRAGRSKGSFWNLYDTAMLGITSYTKMFLRLATIAGFICAGLSLIAKNCIFNYEVNYVVSFSYGNSTYLDWNVFNWCCTIVFTGLMGEYILNINVRVMDRPLVIEEERLNFAEEPEDKSNA